MAVIQISKMQVRRGQTSQTNFPQLSSGEFGWSIDQQQLFIGNGSVAEGAPAVGNTELITEHNINNFFLLANNYTYGTSLPGSEPGAETRSIQAKLDDSVNLNDFISVNDNNVSDITDFTGVLQNAINYAAGISRPLTIPEGTFVISDTLYIPSYTELRGAGPGKTVITNQTTTSTFQTIDSDEFLFEDMSGDSTSPRNVRINGISFVSTLTNAEPIMRLDCLRDSVIEHCEFIGDTTVIGPTTSTQATAINFRSTGGYPANLTNNVTIKNCNFYKVAAAVASDYDIANIEITENAFKNLNEGIVLGKTVIPGVAVGPQHVRITNNTFTHINRQAVWAGSTSTTVKTDINSVNNFYYDVGNNNQGDFTGTSITEVIRFGSFGNYSEGDTFERLERINGVATRNSYIGTVNTSTTRALSVISGPVTIKSKSPIVFDFSPGLNPMFGFPLNTTTYGSNQPNQTVTIDYTLIKPTGGVVRRGKLEVIVIGETATIRDDYTFTGTDTLPVNFVARVWTAPINLLIILTNTSGPAGNITYTFSARQ
jgi:hypothetical protein